MNDCFVRRGCQVFIAVILGTLVGWGFVVLDCGLLCSLLPRV